MHTLQDTWDLGARGLFRLLRATGEIETTQENIEDWNEQDKRDPGFKLFYLFLKK
jgi:hypothetical protein